MAVVWGFAVTLAIFLVGPISGAHLNPAVTLTLVVFRRKDFEARILLAYVPAQLLGAFLAGLIVYGVWEAPIAALELRRNITRGQPGSALSAMMFGEYFPNPAAALMTPVSVGLAFGVEVLGTFLLMLVILAFTGEQKNCFLSCIEFEFEFGLEMVFFILPNILSFCFGGGVFFFRIICQTFETCLIGARLCSI